MRNLKCAGVWLALSAAFGFAMMALGLIVMLALAAIGWFWGSVVGLTGGAEVFANMASMFLFVGAFVSLPVAYDFCRGRL